MTHSTIKDVMALSNTSITTNTTTNGLIIDTFGFEAIEFIVSTGDITDGVYAFKIETAKKADFSDASDVESSDYQVIVGNKTPLTASDDTITRRLGVVGFNRYVRLSIVSTEITVGGTKFSAIAIKAQPKTTPTAD